jgi:hypothetical protein
LHVFLLSFPNTFIIYIRIGEYRQLHGTWIIIGQRPPDRGYFITCSRIGEVHLRQSYEALGMIESIFSLGIEDISEIDLGLESHRDEDGEHSRTNF